MKISRYFSDTEVLVSRLQFAAAQTSAFTPYHAFMASRLAHEVLDPLRQIVGTITVTSWFRSPAVNTAVGGAATSEHLTGGAADIITADMQAAYLHLEGLPYGQRIIYLDATTGKPRWLHVSAQLKDRPAIERSLTCTVGGQAKKYAAFTGKFTPTV